MSTLKEMKELMELGTQMGLKDASLQQFIKDEQVRLRDERELERSERQAREDREYQLKIEKEHTERAREEREHQLLMEERKEQYAMTEHKRRLDEIEVDHKFQALATERSMKVLDSTAITTDNRQSVRGPKLPAFDDANDNIDAYIQRFERYATSQKWNRDNWGAHLSALLKGKALDVFARLPPEDALDFDELKAALYKRFDMNEDGFRKRFRSSKPEGSETFLQFSSRMDSYLERWVELSKTKKTYDGMKDLFLREQFIWCCNKELSLFLKERIPPSIQDMARYADQFVEARTTCPSQVTQDPMFDKNLPQNQTKVQQNNSGNKVKCYACDRYGHRSFECNRKKSQGNRGASVKEKEESSRHVRFTEPQSGYNGGYRGRHSGNGRGGQNRKETSVVKAQQPDAVPEMLQSVKDTVMPVVKGCVGDKVITVLRDTGCSGAVIRKELVLDAQKTGQIQRCLLADGSYVDAEVAEVHVDTPYYTGNVVAWCFDSPSYDLILGNIKGVRKPDEPNLSWIHSIEAVAAVETRSQLKQKQLSYKALKVPEALHDVSLEDMLREQKEDESLRKLWSMAESGKEKPFSDGGMTKMYVKKNLLYRQFSSPKVSNGKVFRQLVVPRKFRTLVMRLAHESLMSGHLGVKKTVDRVLAEFHWPGVQADIRRFCRSCDICQRTIPKGRVPAVPLGQMPIISEPFQRIAVDLVGPLHPITDRGNRYILTIIDYATRYPEAIALPGIETERVAEALVDVFSRVGVPREMLTDQGSQFTSDIMKEVSRLLSLSTSPPLLIILCAMD